MNSGWSDEMARTRSAEERMVQQAMCAYMEGKQQQPPVLEPEPQPEQHQAQQSVPSGGSWHLFLSFSGLVQRTTH